MEPAGQHRPRLWRCPRCDRALEHPRFAAVGCCVPIVHAVGECPMHRSVRPRGTDAELRAELDALTGVVPA